MAIIASSILQLKKGRVVLDYCLQRKYIDFNCITTTLKVHGTKGKQKYENLSDLFEMPNVLLFLLLEIVHTASLSFSLRSNSLQLKLLILLGLFLVFVASGITQHFKLLLKDHNLKSDYFFHCRFLNSC